MPREIGALLSFNRGKISPLALARLDIKRVGLSAEVMTNWIVRVLGPMSLRPGLEHIGASASNAKARYLPFIFATDDTALLEFTANALRVWVDDALITRAAVSSAVTNGNFDADVNNWTDSDEAGGTSAWVAGGYMGLTGNGTAAAIRDQQVTVAAADQGVEHALRIVIQRGPVILRVGSTAGGDDYVREATLGTGQHSLAFTPTGNFHIRFLSRLLRQVLVDSCNVEGAGVLSIPTTYAEADLPFIRGGPDSQSADVVYLSCAGQQQRKIERRSTTSWSYVLYQPEDGPFRIENTGPVTITPSALSGNVTLTASASLFRATQVGALWSLTSSGQKVTASITAENSFTDSIRITGVDATRIFTIIITGLSATGSTVTLQRSLDEPGSWEDVSGKSWTTDTTETFDDGLDNQIVHYRIGVKTGNYVGGTIVCTLQTGIGSITGVVRLTAFTNATTVSAEVLSSLGDTTATDIWAEGEWSDFRGWPTAGTFYEGRLCWAGKNGISASISDNFEGFDPEFEGDAGPISRTIGSGPVDTINWVLPLQRLILGAQGAEFSVRASSFDEVLTPTNFNLKPASTQGSANVPALSIDSRGVYVQRGGMRVMELSFDPNSVQVYDYASVDLTLLVPEIGQPGIVAITVQRQPDTRIHCVRADGTVGIAVFDKVENVLCWLDFETDGDVEDAVVLPGLWGQQDDQVYYLVKRTINGATVRYLEKWALESECQGGTLNKQADSFLLYAGAATVTITGLSHLEGKTVVVWGNGKDLGTKVVSGGQITGLSEAVTNAVVGLPYTAPWQSTKLAYAAAMGSPLTQKKNIEHLGMVLDHTHAKGVQYGRDFDTLYDLPDIEAGTLVDPDTIHTQYDEEAFEFPGSWDTDSRICLQAQAPRPCTVLGIVFPVELHEKY